MAASNGNFKTTWDFGSIGMWVGQGMLAGLFLFAGGFKLMAPAEMMTEGPVVLPVLLLRFIEEMSYEQIASAVGCGVGTVRSRLHYAKRALRREIERNDST